MSHISSTLVGVYLKDSIMNSSAKQYVTWIQTDRGLVLALPLTDCDLGEGLKLSGSQCPHLHDRRL